MTYDPVAVAEAKKYTSVWKHPGYRQKNHALNLWRSARTLFPTQFDSAIDIGCGLGLMIPEWRSQGIDAYGVDLVPEVALDASVAEEYADRVYRATLWDFSPERVFDVGICADVMEHIPEPHVTATLKGMASYCRHVVFKIANFPSRKWNQGEPLHLTLHPAAWWRSRLWVEMGGAVDYFPNHATRPDEYVMVWKAAA